MLKVKSLAFLLSVLPVTAASYYTQRLDDPRAVYVTPKEFGVQGDGKADDTEGIQKAIDKVQETTGQGIVFLPEGQYRLTHTVHIWPGIRLIGYGAQRPVLVLGENTPGYQQGPTYMVFFTGGRPGHQNHGFAFRPATSDEEETRRLQAKTRPPGNSSGRRNPTNGPPDANPGTFYSAISNIDIEIKDGNPGAAAIRARYAQHCFMAHMDFHIGSGLTGIHDSGNLAEDLHFYGGQYGIITKKPSPGWQFTLVDTTFEGQQKAAIKEHEAGLTLVRPHFKNVPTAVEIDPEYSDEFWMKDGRMENITGPAVIISNEKNFRTEVNFENLICDRVPVFAKLRESGKTIAGPAAKYQVKTFSHGLTYADIGTAPEVKTTFDTAALTKMSAAVASDVPDLPERGQWVNVRTLGASGDGVADDTAALRNAIANHRTIYLPSGAYRITDTIQLKPDTVLIGLHPSATRIFIDDSTAAFQGVGDPKPLIETPKGGTNIVMGVGLYTNGINPRAVGAKWMAGKNSLMNDVRFLGGHGTSKLNGDSEDIYNNTHTADTNLLRRWDSQYASLWVTDGGGGTFMNIWTPSTFAQAGMYISNTSTEGRVYEMSSEHHVRSEIKLQNASNWSIYSLQTEEERGEGGFALPLEIDHSSNITVANFHIYRVVSSYQPFPYAVKVTASRNIRFRNFHCYSDSKVSFDSAVFDRSHKVEVRQREFASLTISGTISGDTAPLQVSNRVQKLASGFYNISGAAADNTGELYFVDAHWQKIYRWSLEEKAVTTVSDAPLAPVQLAFDKADNLLVISQEGKGIVYALKPNSPGQGLTLLKPEKSADRPGLTPVLPVDIWRNENDFQAFATIKKPFQVLSPDGTTFLPVGDDFVTGQLYYGAKMHDVIRAFGLAPAEPGKPFYISDENQERTYAATIAPDGSISNLKWFAERGGEAAVADRAGNVYIAAGQIYVYNPAGALIDTINVPERPLGLVFGGKDRGTLFILARTSLYSLKP